MKNAFTMIELIFVIVVIGILAAIAVPKFSETTNIAHLAKAKSQLISVMTSIAAERQKRILRADFNPISGLGSGSYAFSNFTNGNQDAVVQFPIKNCATDEKGCWTRSGTSYVYKFVDSGSANFKLENNRLVCDDDSADCAKLLD
jgi:general secretion pathway protein G